jgi:long-chain fatty acid transport protein
MEVYMKKMIGQIAAYVIIAAMATSLAVAGGYQINEHSARAVGMGGAFTALANDGSAIFYNAGGLGFQSGTNVLLGTTLIFPSTSFTGPGASTTKTDMESQMFYPSNLYITHALNDQLVVGLGVFSPYGLGTEWPNDWVGRKISVKTDLQTFYINPTVAYKVNDELSVGVGLSYVLGSAKIKYRVGTYSSLAPPTPATTDGTAGLDGDGSGISFNVGIIYKPMEKLSIGASYRSLVDIELSGTASFTDMQALQSFFPGGDGKVTLPMPSNLQVGVAYDVSPELTVAADVQLVGWSAYDKLQITLASGPAAPAALGGQPLQKSPAAAVKDWDNGTLIRIGGEYKVDENLAVRLGYIRDMTPQPIDKMEPMLPDADRNDLSIGAGYKINENLRADLSYLLVLFADRTSTMTGFTGTYKSSASLISVNIGYQF